MCVGLLDIVCLLDGRDMCVSDPGHRMVTLIFIS